MKVNNNVHITSLARQKENRNFYAIEKNRSFYAKKIISIYVEKYLIHYLNKKRPLSQ